jgi:methionyl-tRNA synthetase
MITFDEFKKMEIKVAKIIEVKEHPQADKLYVLKVDTGQEIKQLVAGIRKSYSKEELLNKNIVIVDNLQPAVIRGIESQGMLLAAADANNLSLIIPEKTVAIGSPVH